MSTKSYSEIQAVISVWWNALYRKVLSWMGMKEYPREPKGEISSKRELADTQDRPHPTERVGSVTEDEQSAAGLAEDNYLAGGSDEPVAPSEQAMVWEIAPLQILAHVRNHGDLGSDTEGWAGIQQSGLAIEGIALTVGIPASAITYAILLADSALSDPVSMGEYCGTRGLTQPIFGFIITVDEVHAPWIHIEGEARFIDGTQVPTIQGGILCKAESGAALEAVRLKFLRAAYA